MIGGSLALCLAGLVQSAPVFLEWSGPEAPVYREQVVALRLRLGVERAFLEESMVQSFRRELEFPVQLQTAFDAQQWRLRPRHEPEDPALPRLVLDGAIVQADRLREERRDGRAYWVAELDWTALPLVAGEALAARATVHYAWTEERGADLFGDPVAANRQDAELAAVDAKVRVLEWPEADRPPAFRGAVGDFLLEAAPLAGGSGELLRLRLAVAGEGNWETLEPPALDAVRGFHLLGRLIERAPQRVTVTAEFALDAETPEVFPAVEFSFFDPARAGYRSVSTQPIALPAGAGATSAGTPPAPPSPGFGPEAGSRGLLLALAVATLGVWTVVLALWLRRRAPRRSAPPTRAPEAAASDADPASALTAFLERTLGVHASRLHAPDLRALLRTRGIPEPLAGEAAALFEALQAERYGGPAVLDAEPRWAQLRARWPAASSGAGKDSISPS